MSVGLTAVAIHRHPPDLHWKAATLLVTTGVATIAMAALAALVFIWVLFSGCGPAGCSID